MLLGLIGYAILSFLNSSKGIRYLGILLIAAIALTVSSFLRLPGLHIISQATVVVLLVGFPIFFHDQWTQLLNRTTQTIPGHLPKYLLGVIAAVVAAVAIFLGSGGLVKIAELPSEITVKAVNLPEGTTANFGSGESVRIIVSAPRDIWDTLNDSNFSATVDAANRSEGTYDLDVVVSSSLESVRIVNVKPEKAVVTIEPIIRKTAPVSLRVTGKAGNDLIAGTPAINPDKVEITGSKAAIAGISQVYAEIELSGETADIALDVTLKALDAVGETIPSIKIAPESVSVKLPLVKAGNSKSVAIQPAVTGTPAIGYWVKSITVNPVIVSVQGTADLLSSIQQINTESISVEGASGDITQSVKLSLPNGVTVSSGDNAVNVVITLEKIDTTKSINPEIVYDSLDGALKVTETTPTSISAVVSGSSDTLQSLSGSSVQLKLDLSSYKSPGTYSVTLKNSFFVLPDGVGLVSFLPSSIDVTLDNR